MRKGLFIVSLGVFLISGFIVTLSILSLHAGSSPYPPDLLSVENIAKAKSIAEHCKFTPQEKETVDKLLFEAEKQLNLHGDLEFGSVQYRMATQLLLECEYNHPLRESFIESNPVLIGLIISVASLASTIYFAIRRKK